MSIEAFLRQGFIPFRDAVGRETGVLSSAARELAERAAAVARARPKPDHVTFVGIGASFAALAGPTAFLSGRGVPAVRLNPAEVDASAVRGTMVALSQSGRSRETVEVVRQARGPRLAVVNVTDSPLAGVADAVLSLGDLPDSLASTIGFSASVMAVSMLCEVWTDGAPSPAWLDLGERLEAFLARNGDAIEAAADLLSRSTAIDFVAPHDQIGIAEGNALLIREVARKPTSAFETRQYLHGLMEATGETTAHIVLEGPDDGQIIRALSTRHGNILEFRRSPGSSRATVAVSVASQSALELPIFVAAFMQHAVLRSAFARDIDPDEFLFLDTGTKLGDGE